MQNSYKMNRSIAERIIELKFSDGLSGNKISKLIADEFGFKITASAINQFYSNYMKGSSKLLPKNRIINAKKINIQDHNYANNAKLEKKIGHNQDNNRESKKIESPLLDQLTENGSLSTAKKPSSELMSFYIGNWLIKKCKCVNEVQND